jgi:hypothetical protein
MKEHESKGKTGTTQSLALRQPARPWVGQPPCQGAHACRQKAAARVRHPPFLTNAAKTEAFSLPLIFQTAPPPSQPAPIGYLSCRAMNCRNASAAREGADTLIDCINEDFTKSNGLFGIIFGAVG